MANLGVNRVGKVNGRRLRGQGDDPSLRSKHVDLILFKIELQGIEELNGIADLTVDIGDPLHPSNFILAGGLLFVPPVGSDAVLRARMHLLGSNLHFDWSPIGTNDRGVK